MGQLGRNAIFEKDLTKMSKEQNCIYMSMAYVFGKLHYSAPPTNWAVPPGF
jgi:hypothetical protein